MLWSRKICVIIMALLLSILCFSACNKAEKPETSKPDTTEPVSVTEKEFDDNTPDFEFNPKNVSDFNSREDVYGEIFRLKEDFDDFTGKYGSRWSGNTRCRQHRTESSRPRHPATG